MIENVTTDRAFVLGLDGVPWRLIKQWTAQDELPNFARMIRDGSAGELESTKPATTPIAWPTIATGARSDQHGVYGFVGLTESYTPNPYDRTDLKRPALWDIVSPAVVGNVPMTYPPSSIDGKMVSGMMTPDLDAGFAKPETLETQIRRDIPDYEISLNWNRYRENPESLVADLHSLVETRRKLMRLLMETQDWRLFFFVYTAPDRLQHLFWDEAVLLDHYRTLDEILGEVMDYCSEHDANLFVVSDHGFGPIDRTINVNAILEAEGFLVREETSRSKNVLSSLGLTKSRVERLVRATGLNVKTLLTMLPDRVVNDVANSIPGDNVLYDINYARTSAFMHGPGNVYINTSTRFDAGSVDPDDREAVKSRLQETLMRATDPESDTPLFDVHDGSALFPTDSAAPDLVVEPRDGYDLRARLADSIVEDSGPKAGSHRSEGVLMAWGPDIAAGVSVADATVFDVAPTVLHSLEEPIPRVRAGNPLLNVFSTDRHTDPNTITTTDYDTSNADESEGVADDFEAVEERLRGLGYVE